MTAALVFPPENHPARAKRVGQAPPVEIEREPVSGIRSLSTLSISGPMFWRSAASGATPEYVEITDAQLLERMSRGDQAALGLLYERYSADLMRVVLAVVKDRSLAADTVQDVFLEAWKKAELFDASRGSAKAWLVVRARSRSLDRLRSISRKKEVELTDTSRGQIGSTQQTVDALQLPEALSLVNEEEREVLMLGYFEGLTSAEMSEHLGVPEGTIKSRTRRALIKLREFWEEKA